MIKKITRQSKKKEKTPYNIIGITYELVRVDSQFAQMVKVYPNGKRENVRVALEKLADKNFYDKVK